jgi:membrane fusion protein
MHGGLFRREVIDAQQNHRDIGKILLTQSLPLWGITLVIVMVVVAILVFLSLGEWTRKERVFGLTVPGHGAIRLAAQELGVVYAAHVKEGSKVNEGDLLFEIRQEKYSDLGETQHLIEKNLTDQGETLASEIRTRLHQEEQEALNLQKKAELLKQEIDSLDVEIQLQSQHVSTVKSLLENMRPLFEERIIPELQYQQQVSTHIQQLTHLEALNRERITIASRHMETLNEIHASHLRAKADQSALERTLLATKQQGLVQRSAHLRHIRAPVTGTISNIQVDVGRHVEGGKTLATLLPKGIRLDIQIYVPSNAIGFLNTGQQVKLRYDAFPYQKFGVYEGELTELANVDVPMQELQGRFPHLMEKYRGLTFFRAKVRPAAQSIQAYGAPIPLRAGLTLEADIHLERKRLIEWIFDPVMALGGNI